jgi:hypothetical protein
MREKLSNNSEELFDIARGKIESLMKFSLGQNSGYFLADAVISDSRESLDDAKAAGANVLELESKFNSLISQARLTEAIKTFVSLSKFARGENSGYATAEAGISDLKEEIAKAKEAGANVAFLENELQGIEKAAREKFAGDMTKALSNFVSNRPSGYFSIDSILGDVKRSLEKLGVPTEG